MANSLSTTDGRDIASIDATSQSAMVYTTAVHEAGHAVMRWILGRPATELAIIDGQGSGYCAGDGHRISHRDNVRLALAGPAAESGCFAIGLDLQRSHGQDLDKARESIAAQWGGGPVDEQSIAFVLQTEFGLVCDLLFEHLDLLEAIAARLERDRMITPRQIAAMCREYHKRRQVRRGD